MDADGWTELRSVVSRTRRKEKAERFWPLGSNR